MPLQLVARRAVAQREVAMQRRMEEFLSELLTSSRRTEEGIEARAREADELVQVRVQRPGGWPAVVPRGYARATSFCRARACWLRAPLASS